MESKLAQRTADFVSGGVYALHGQERRVGERVLLFAPSSVDIDQLS
jgi:cell division inhibitor SepF